MYHFSPSLTWLLDIVCLLFVFGVVAEIGSWIVGPSAGLQTAAGYGLMPQWITHENKHGVPTHMILAQTVVVIIWDAVLTLGGGSGNVSFLVATKLTTLIYLVCYFLMYIAYFRLIFTEKALHRTYNVPGGIVGKTIVGVCGLATSIFAFVMSFTPSSALTSSEDVTFLILLVICFIIAIIIPLLITAFSKKYVAGLDPSQIKQLKYKLDKNV